MRFLTTLFFSFLLIVPTLISWEFESASAFLVGVLAYMVSDTWTSTWWPK